MRLALTPLVLFAGLSACSQEPDGQTPADGEPAATAIVEPDGGPSREPEPGTSGEAGGRAFIYTSLTDCEVVREELEEMPYTETRCPGLAGWALRITDSDARNNLLVIDPAGKETSLDLGRVVASGFSSLGQTAEWRGPAGGTFAPDSLIVRFQVAEDPYPEPETSYLLAIDLAPRPCVVARVAPGPAQNSIARSRADDPGACLAQ